MFAGHGSARLAKLLRPVARVEPGEGGTVVLLMVTLFLLLTSYYLLKTAREPLILVGGGAELKSYTAAGQALLLVFLVPAYGAFVNRVGRVRLINRVQLFFVGNIVLFYVLARLKVPYLGVPFFVWVGIFSLMVIAQLWSFANDLYTPEQGRRLFPVIAVGSSVGAIAGAWLAGVLLDAGVGVYEMLLVAAGTLLGCVGLTDVVQRRERARIAAIGAGAPPPRAAGGPSGFTLVRRDRYLLLLALLLLLLNTVNTTGEYILGRTVRQAAQAAVPGGSVSELNAYVGAFYAHFFTWVNAVGAVMQLFLVSRLLGWLGVPGALLVLPLIALGGYTALAAAPALLLIRAVKTLENATDYSLHNTVRQALFLPTSPEAKYKAKQAIDTFFVRMGDVASAGLVLLGTTIGLTTSQFALVAAGLVVVWFLVALAIGRRYRRLAAAAVLAGVLASPAAGAEAPSDTTRHPGPVPLTVLRGTSALPGRSGTLLQHAGHWLLAPPYWMVSAVSWPFEQGAALNEKHHLASRLTRLLVWRLDEFETDIALTFGYASETGLGAIGVRTRADDWIGTGARLDLAAAYIDGDQSHVSARLSQGGDWRWNAGARLTRDRRQSFYGFGPDTTPDDRFRADRHVKVIEANAGWRGLAAGGYLRRVTLHERPPDAPPFWAQAETAEYASAEASWTWDRRDDGEFSRRGAYLRVLGGLDAARTAGDADYRHYGVQAQGYLDLRHGRALATRLWAEAIDGDDLTRVPYTEWPALGGSQLLRGYDNHRFADARALLLSAEYRWPVFAMVSARLFTDWGAVAPSWSRLRADRIDPAYGLALVARLHRRHSVALQVARGEEWQVYVGTALTFTALDRQQR